MTAHDARRVAVAAMCDPRSVRAYLSGRAIRDMARQRIEKALADLGFGSLVRGAA